MKASNVALLGLLLSGCSYYGTQSILKSGEKAALCSSGKSAKLLGHPFVARDKTWWAILAVPVIPSPGEDKPNDLGEITVWYENGAEDVQCHAADITLVANGDIHVPSATERRSYAANDGRTAHMSCDYRFSTLKPGTDYALSFRKGLMGCHLPDIALEHESKPVHEVIPIQ